MIPTGMSVSACFRVEALYTIGSEKFREHFEVSAEHPENAQSKVVRAICGMFKNVVILSAEVVAS